MNLEQAPIDTSTSQLLHSHAGTRLRGGWLILVRVAWVVVLVLALVLFIVSIPIKYADAHTLCSALSCSNSDRLTLEKVHELQNLGISIDFQAFVYLVLSLIFECVYVATGVIIFWHKSDDRMALVTSFALITFGTAFQISYLAAGTLPPVVHILSLLMAFLGNSCIGLFFYLFPTGRFVLRWVRWLAICWIAYWGFNNVFLVSFVAGSGLNAVVFLSLIASVIPLQVYQYRRVSTPLQRQQTKWVVFGLSLAMVGFLFTLVVISNFSHTIVGPLLFIFLLFIPLSLGMAILRSHLWDIDIIINRTLVYGLLTASVIGIYSLVVGTLGTLLQVQGNFIISLLAAGLVAMLFQPLRLNLQRGVNRLMYGERDAPSKVISRLGQRLETTLAPEAVLPTIVQTVAQALKLPYAAITLKQAGEFVPAASYGQAPMEDLVRLPLVYQNEQVGELLLAPRAPGETFSSADRALLDDLARQAGVAASAVRLTTDLQRLASELQHSRTQLVTAREEERRRLRRDLHDGLGPALGSLTLQLDTARNLFRSDSFAADALLVDLKIQVQTAITDIRRLVYELRPPTLDELGLVSALREQVTRYRKPGLSITLNAPELLPPLPAAVEVAIYRIAQEALTNVVRHASAQHCAISLDVDSHVCLEVRDDGQGLPANYQAGVGLTSMRERAAELGGTCTIGSAEAGGTRVFVRLPGLQEEEHGRTYPRADRR